MAAKYAEITALKEEITFLGYEKSEIPPISSSENVHLSIFFNREPLAPHSFYVKYYFPKK